MLAARLTPPLPRRDNVRLRGPMGRKNLGNVMSVDTETVAKIAALARIKLGEDELAAMVPELNAILGWVEQLGEVDVTGIEPMTAVIENHLRLREDVIDADPLTGGGKRDAILANAPMAEHGFFGVPKVIE